jgi:FKBP-type peptidyl-prolyl cis-trans isomerase 2
MELPEYVKVRRVTALRAGVDVKHKVTGQTLEFTLPAIADYEIAAVTKG